MDDQVGIAADGRSEVGVGGGGEGEVSAIFFGVAGLLERAQHQETQDAFFWRAGNFFGEFLVHARGDVDFFWHFDFADALAGSTGVAAVGFQLDALNWKCADSQGVTESCGDDLEIVNALGVGLFVDTVERGDAFIFQVVGYAFVGREHEFFNQAVSDVAFGARDAFHHSEFIELDDGFGEIEVNRSPALAFAIEDHGQVAHAFKVVDLIFVFDAGRCLAQVSAQVRARTWGTVAF